MNIQFQQKQPAFGIKRQELGMLEVYAKRNKIPLSVRIWRDSSTYKAALVLKKSSRPVLWEGLLGRIAALIFNKNIAYQDTKPLKVEISRVNPKTGRNYQHPRRTVRGLLAAKIAEYKDIQTEHGKTVILGEQLRRIIE